MNKRVIGKIDNTNIYLSGINLFSEDGEYGFSFITPNKGAQHGKRIPFSYIKKSMFVNF